MPVLLVDDCLVELDSRHGAIVGMDSSIKIRPLPP
jgi:hypothetical protein